MSEVMGLMSFLDIKILFYCQALMRNKEISLPESRLSVLKSIPTICDFCRLVISFAYVRPNKKSGHIRIHSDGIT